MIQEKPLNNLELEKSTSRRSRKDEEGRDFQCGCGKRYLSYPALYTHIKTKHDGRQPEGTQKTGTTMTSKKTKGKCEDQTLKGLTSYLDKMDIKLLGELDQNYLGSVSLHSRFKKDSLPKEVYQAYQNLMKQPDIHISKTSSLEVLLALYLFNVGQYINDKLYDHYVLFVKLLRNCYHQHGQQVFRTCFTKREENQPSTLKFTAGEVQFVPIICDCLLRYYIPCCQSTVKEYKDIDLSLMELMISDFCEWLFRKKFTNIKVTLKKQYRLESKPSPLPKHRNSQKADKDKEHKEESISDSHKKSSSNINSSEQDSSEEADEEENIDDGPVSGQNHKTPQGNNNIPNHKQLLSTVKQVDEKVHKEAPQEIVTPQQGKDLAPIVLKEAPAAPVQTKNEEVKQ